MGLKILHSADWHMGSPFGSFSGAQRDYLVRAQMEIPGRIAALCRDQGCDLVLLAGDIFDGPCSREWLDLVRDGVEDCGVPVCIAPGNHDPWGVGSPWEQPWPGNVCVFPPELGMLDLEELDCRVYGAGFGSMDCPALMEGFRAEPGPRYQIGIFHGDPLSASSHYNPITTAQIRDSGLAYLALGHIHKAGQLDLGQTLCAWPGCPMGRGWDETGEKSCLLVTLDGRVRLQAVPLGMPQFHQQTLEVGSDPVKALEQILPPATYDFFRITLTGYGSPDVAELYRHFRSVPNLELRDRTTATDNIWDQAGEDTLRGVYFQRLREAATLAEPEERQRILLAAEISRKLLEGREVLLP